MTMARRREGEPSQQTEMLREQMATVLHQFGLYQCRLYLYMVFPLIMNGYKSMSVILTFASPQHRCRVPGMLNDTFSIQSDAHRMAVNLSIPMTSSGDDVSYSKCDVYKDRDERSAANRTLNGDTEPCDSWVYDVTDFDNTIVTQFDLVCGDKGLRATFNMMYMLGLLAGSSVSGILCDRFGRKRVFLWALTLSVVVVTAMAFPVLPPLLLAYRFFIAALDIIGYMGLFVLVLEFMGPERRTLAAVLPVVFWVMGPVLVGVLSYVIRDWRWLQVLNGAPFVLCLSYWWLVDESPRWLLSRGRVQEARKVILKVMKVNKIPVPADGPLAEDVLQMEDLHQHKTSTVENNDLREVTQTETKDMAADVDKEKTAETDTDRRIQQPSDDSGKEKTAETDTDRQIQQPSDDSGKEKTAETDREIQTQQKSDNTGKDSDVEGKIQQQSFLGIFKYPHLIARTGILFINWSAISTSYYGLSLNVTNLAGDLRLNFFLSNLVELVGTGATWLLLDRQGRKRTHCASMLLAGLACLCTVFSVMLGGPELQWLTILLVMVGKLGISAAFTIIYLMTGELFPTVIRIQGLGYCSTGARVATALSPYIADLSLHIEGSVGRVLPMVIFGALALTAGLLALCLPETLHRTLPDTILQAAHFTKSQSDELPYVQKKNDGSCSKTST